MPKNGLALPQAAKIRNLSAALRNKFKSIFSFLQGPALAFQIFQVLRYAAQILGAAGLAWLLKDQQALDSFESLLLLGSSTTFFWVGGILDAYLVLHKKADLLHAQILTRQASLTMAGLSITSALLTLALGCLLLPDISLHLLGLFAAYLLLESLAQFAPYLLIATTKPQALIGFAVMGSLGYVAALLLPIALGAGLEGIFLGLVLVGLAKLACLLWWLQDTGSKTAARSKGHTKEIWAMAAPLILATLLSQGAVYVDGYLVQHYFPDHFVAFRYGAKEFPLVLLLANGMSVVRAGEVSQGLRDANLKPALEGIKAGTIRLAAALFPVSLAFLLGSDWLFEYAFAGRFPEAVLVFDLYLLLIIPRLLFPQTILRGHQRTGIMSWSAAVELVLNIALSLLLMQWWGIAGIAAATVIAFLVEKIILLVYVHAKIRIKWSQYAPVGLWLVGSLAMLLSWLIKYH